MTSRPSPSYPARSEVATRPSSAEVETVRDQDPTALDRAVFSMPSTAPVPASGSERPAPAPLPSMPAGGGPVPKWVGVLVLGAVCVLAFAVAAGGAVAAFTWFGVGS